MMLFAFMLSDKDVLNTLQKMQQKVFGMQHVAALLVAVAFLVVLVTVITKTGAEFPGWMQISPEKFVQPEDNTANLIGVQVMTRYLLPFELVSVFLMMALVGAAHIARKEPRS